jgi:hypothetical protein
LKRGAPDITTATTTKGLTFDSAINPATTNQVVDNAALGSALGLGGEVSIPALIAAAAFVALFVLLIPLGYIYGWIGYNVIDPIFGVPNELAVPSAATVAVDEKQASIANTQDPALNSETARVDVSTSATTAPNLFENLLPIVGPVILFGAIAVGLFVLAPAIVVYDSIAPLIGLPTFTEWQLSTAQTSTASVEQKATNARVATVDQEEGNSLPATVTAVGAPDEKRGEHRGTTDDSLPVTSTDTLTQTGQTMSTQVTNEQISTETGSLAGDPSEPTKPTQGSATHRPVLRGLVKVGERVRDLLHLDDRGGSTVPAATSEVSSPTSSTTGEDTPGGSTPDGEKKTAAEGEGGSH